MFRPEQPTLSHPKKTTAVATIVVHRPNVINDTPIKVTTPDIPSKAKAKPFPKTSSIVRPPTNFLPPLPLPPFNYEI